MQLVRHHSAKPLVTSLRYTGKQFTDINWQSSEEDIDKLFYYSKEGDYLTRDGKFDITLQAKTRFYEKVRMACVDYKLDLNSNIPEEVARRGLPAGYRQSMVMSGTARTWFHILDQRLLKNSQPECQEAANLILEQLSIWYPVLFKWYTDNRAGKNLLSP
jgi:flavin-dependent thymidylate synthase